ncbi:MAG: hypothetical protein ABR508_05605 [Candidatus Baltobacteraceae bacterium]
MALFLALDWTAASAHGWRLLPKPPGVVVQDRTVSLTGEGMRSHWRAIVSKTLAGRMRDGAAVYQWHLSIYAPASGNSARLAYQSPGRSALLATVQKARDAPMYFPLQTLSIVGTAELERPAVQDLVVAFQESGADCGMATVAVLGADAHGRISVRKSLTNYCSLHAAVVRGGELAALRITGPYYTARSAVCCPAKAKATAILRYRNGAWILTPAIFPPAASRLP